MVVVLNQALFLWYKKNCSQQCTLVPYCNTIEICILTEKNYVLENIYK